MIDLRRRPQQLSAAEGRPIATRLLHLVYVLAAPFFLMVIIAVGILQIQTSALDRLVLVLGPAADANGLVLRTMLEAEIEHNASVARQLLTPDRVVEARTMATLATLAALATLQGKLNESSSHDAALRTDLIKGQRLAVEQWWAHASSTEQAAGRGDRVDDRHGRVLFDNFLLANIAVREYIANERARTLNAAQTLATKVTITVIVIALMTLLAGLALGVRFARSIGQPIAGLHDAMTRQRAGEPDARAREDLGPLEIRSLATNFNALTKQNLDLQQIHSRDLRMHELSFEIERAIRLESDIQHALNVLCIALGEGLGVDRVMAKTFDPDHNVLLHAQWHLPNLPPLPDMSPHLISHSRLHAEELWLASDRRVLSNLLSPRAQFPERAQMFHRETDAHAVIIAPIGQGDWVFGIIYVIMVNQPREWTPSEANAVQQVAAFVAQVIVDDEHQKFQNEYIDRLERLDQQKTNFLATVSHELRTPLTSISGYLELLQDGDAGELTGEQHQVLEVVDRNTRRLTSLIGDLLVLNQIESGGLKLNVTGVSMRELITHAGEELYPLVSSGAVELDIDAGPEAAIVQGDRGHLHRAVVNIVSNAIKFSHPGGVVTIRCTLDQGARRVLFTCEDNGIGIPADDQEQLFSRFYRASNATDQAIAGTGLGLSIVKQIVEDHGGELRLTSVEGEGTTVVIDLPLSAPD